MKKMIICAAVVLAAVLSSCGDTKQCHKITTTIGDSETVTYFFGTPNDLDPVIEKAKALAELAGGKVKSVRVPMNEADCNAANKN